MKLINVIIKILMPLILGGAILYWMYRDFDLESVKDVLTEKMNWTWMLLSFPFGVFAQVFRGWRWCQTLEPIGERPRLATSVNSIFVSYAASLLIPRIGEFTRCGILKRYDGVSFAKALGTVVTERAVDSLVVAAFCSITLVSQMGIFTTFFDRTGTSFESMLGKFSFTGYTVTFICGLAAIILLHYLLKKLSFYDKVKTSLSGILQGILSLKNVRNIPLFIILTIGLWVCYFLHYYLTFFCFDFTSHLGLGCAMVTFAVGSMAVIVPTPNGAGPWHFAVKTMLILYGVADVHALYFVLIVHTIQTLLVILLGMWGCGRLAFSKVNERN